MLTLAVLTPFTVPETKCFFPETTVTIANTRVSKDMPREGVHAVSNDPLGILKCHGNGALLFPPSTFQIVRDRAGGARKCFSMKSAGALVFN
jgi:hypothetical protein